MKSPLPIALFALALSVAALALVVLQSPAGSAPSEEPQPDQDDALFAKLDELAASDRDLRAELDQLRMTLAMAPTRTASGPSEGLDLSSSDLDLLVELVRSELIGSPRSTGPTSPGGLALGGVIPSAEVAAQVEATLANLQLEAAREKAAGVYEKRATVLRDNLPTASTKLGLSASQEADLEGAILTLFDQQASYEVQLAEGIPPEQIGQSKTDDYASFQQSLTTILSPTQLEEYQQLNAWMFPGINAKY